MLFRSRVAEQNGVEVKIYENQSELIAFGNLKLTPDAQFISRSSVPTIMLDICRGENHVLYTSAAYIEREDRENVSDKIQSADTLIVGARGPKVKEKYTLFGKSEVDEIIICDIDRAIYLDVAEIDNSIPIYVGKKHKNILVN